MTLTGRFGVEMKHTPRSKTNGLGASKSTKSHVGPSEIPKVRVDYKSVPPLMLERKLRYKKRRSLPQLQEAEILKNIGNIKDRI